MSSATIPLTGAGRHGVQRLASRLAVTGASLGVLAGLVELTVGASMRTWIGDKADTTRLGLATILLSAIALTAAVALRRAQPHRVAVILGLGLPAVVCFSTVGRLWYLPGALLLAAAGLVVAGTPRYELKATIDARRWRAGLLVVCGACYVLLGATALGVAGALGIAGGMLVWGAALTSRSPRTGHVMLLAGALPFAVATWWSVVTPVLAGLILVLGHGIVRRAE